LKRVFLAVLLLLACRAAALADPAMWVVKGKDSTVYLLGTIHVLKPGVKWRSDKLTAAFQASRQYWMEADIDTNPAIAATYALNFGMDTEHALSEKLDAKDYALFVKLVTARGLREGQVRFARPWFASLLLTESAFSADGYDPMLGVDRSLEDDARQAGKPVMGLETTDEHMGVLAHLPPKVELSMLVDMLHEIGAAEENTPSETNGAAPAPSPLDALEAAWLAGDLKGLNAAGFQEMTRSSPEFFDALITKRNANWVPKISELLDTPGTYFVAVGAGHLIGPKGVPELLKAKGYKVERY
jgi:uncharacterized protein YbaP (TraB family)